MFKNAKVTMTKEEFEALTPKERAEILMTWVSPEKSKDFLTALIETGTIAFQGSEYPKTILTLTHGRVKIGDVSQSVVSTDGVHSSEAAG